MPNALWITVKMMITDELAVVEADLLGQVVERVDQRLLRQHVRQQEQPDDPEPAADPADAQRVGVEQRDRDGEDGDRPGDQDRVPQLEPGKLTRCQ